MVSREILKTFYTPLTNKSHIYCKSFPTHLSFHDTGKSPFFPRSSHYMLNFPPARHRKAATRMWVHHLSYIFGDYISEHSVNHHNLCLKYDYELWLPQNGSSGNCTTKISGLSDRTQSGNLVQTTDSCIIKYRIPILTMVWATCVLLASSGTSWLGTHENH